MIWEKNNTGMGDLEGDYAPKYEMILFCSNGSKKLNGGRDANILKAKRTGNENHPTEKPVNLISYLIEKSSNENDIVLATFTGSFSTAQACKQKKRNFICFEIEEEYCRTQKTCLMVYLSAYFSAYAFFKKSKTLLNTWRGGYPRIHPHPFPSMETEFQTTPAFQFQKTFLLSF